MTMTPAGAVPAKISPPRLPRVLRRERLFAALGEALEQPLVWISGPAGAGKTTLVASYLQARGLPAMWYHVDGHDADLATCFHFLGLAAERLQPEGATPLPHLTRGYLAGVASFAQQFFQAVSAQLRAPSVLVFDDCHRLGNDAEFYGVLPDVLAGLPPGISAVFISRNEPPPGWARLRINQTLRVLDWDSLRLTPEEIEQLGDLRGKRLSAEALQRLTARTQGWAAGLMLLLEQADPAELPATLDDASQQVVFDYFAGELFQRYSAPMQEFLLRTAILPRITVPVAQQLTGHEDAAQRLRELARGNHFTLQHAGGEAFEYHPLFRDFLLHRGLVSHGPVEGRELRREAGRLLAEAGDAEGAAEMFMQSEDWERLVPLILEQARSLFKQGRYRTLQSWIESLPAERLADEPWLLYWLGSALQPFDLVNSRARLEQAYRRFKEIGDPVGLYLAWSGAVDTCLYIWGDFKALDYWLDELRDLQAGFPEYPSVEIEARVAYCMLNALMRRRPHDRQIQFWSERCEAMLQSQASLVFRMMIGNTLVLYHMRWSGNVQRMMVATGAMRALVRAGEAAPLAQITWKIMEAGACWVANEPERCLEAVEEGFALSREAGTHFLDFMLYTLSICGSLAADDLERAQRYLERMPDCLSAAVNRDAATHYYLLVALVALHQGDPPRAREHAELALERILDSEAPLSMSFDAISAAQVLLECGQTETAQAAMNFARRWGRKVNNTFLEFHCLLFEAEQALIESRPREALTPLSKALALGREQGYRSHPWLGWRRPLIGRLYLLALAEGIEVEYVQSLVRGLKLVPAEAPPAHLPWPWPLRVRSLGQFSLSIDGETAGGKRGARGKPLELLQALIACGGEEVAEQVLTDLLWPDTDGDAAHHTFETTLYRLRKLVGDERALVLHNGRLSLDPRYCWLDVWALQQQLKRLEQLIRDDAPAEALAPVAAELAFLYRGPFLAANHEPWAEAPRQRLHGQILQALTRLAGCYETRGDYDAAASHYQWAFELEPLAEEVCQRLMVCCTRLGRTAEAMSVFQRCANALAGAGTQPGAATLAMRDALV